MKGRSKNLDQAHLAQSLESNKNRCHNCSLPTALENVLIRAPHHTQPDDLSALVVTCLIDTRPCKLARLKYSLSRASASLAWTCVPSRVARADMCCNGRSHGHARNG